MLNKGNVWSPELTHGYLLGHSKQQKAALLLITSHILPLLSQASW